ncbi:MAG TPA: type VI secretion system baseplate subunit TssE [Nannocystis sp.]
MSGGDNRLVRTPGRGLYRRLAGSTVRRSEQEAVVAHLQAILNTHIGESMSSAQLGIIDFADVVHNFPASAQALLHSIRATILQYEPRLRTVSIQPVASSDPLALAFEISARYVDERRGSLRLRTELSVNGRFNVQGS